MVQGMLSGSLTLFWAVLILLLTVYTVALVCRSIFGFQETSDVVGQYFDSVPRSMYTVFRCSFGDCSSAGGTPLPEHIITDYGAVHSGLYCVFTFMITIGLFNIISAIFVDATVNSAAEVAQNKFNLRLDDENLWAVNVTKIIQHLLLANHEFHGIELDRLSTILDTVATVELPRETLEQVVLVSPEVNEALDQLDIDFNDHKRLADVMDPDHSGTVTVFEVMCGLQQLRGQPRRSDVIIVDLMVRSLQEKVEALAERVETVVGHARDIADSHRKAKHSTNDLHLSVI